MIVILIPVLNRPDRAEQVVNSIHASTSVPHRILFLCSPGDDVEIQACRATGADVHVVDFPVGPGDYAKKINRGYQLTTEPYIFTGADDLCFHHGWDTAALAKFTDGIGVVGTNDLGNPRVLTGEHSTHSLVSREYAEKLGTIDGPGAIYVECYPHEFVDDEFCGTAMSRNAYAHAHDSVVEHLHPNWNKAPKDHLTSQAPRRLSQGRRIYQTRRRRWEPNVAPDKRAPISVIIATYGDESWKQLAQQRALPSVNALRPTVPFETIVHHSTTLADARNEAAAQATSPWLCFLDADDELSSNYIHVMARMTRAQRAGLLNPAVQFVVDGKPKPRKTFSTRDLRTGNYLVIGTVIRKDLFWRAGGFDPQWEAWEDWALFWKIVDLGGRIIRVPGATYKAHWSSTGRNNTVPDTEGLRARIVAEHDEWKASLSKERV